jgi:hypothetical protein
MTQPLLGVAAVIALSFIIWGLIGLKQKLNEQGMDK